MAFDLTSVCRRPRASSVFDLRCQSETFPIPNAVAELLAPMAEVLTDSYITLTPTAASDSQRGSHSAPASDLLARKWAAAAKRKASMEVMKVHEPGPEDDTDRDSSRTETDRSSELGNDETPSSDGDDVSTSSKVDPESEDENENDDDEEDDEEEEEQQDVIPTYVCELHDPKPVLVGE